MPNLEIQNAVAKLDGRIELADELSTEEKMRRVIQVLSDGIKKLEERVTLLEKL